MGEIRRQLRYKCDWYGANLIEADRYFPSSKTCHECDHVQDIGWAEYWTCEGCDGPIAPERLAARPATRTCISCAATLRRGA